jgi:hypothetical protein
LRTVSVRKNVIAVAISGVFRNLSYTGDRTAAGISLHQQ